MGVGKVTHGRGSGLTVTRAERPDGIGALLRPCCHSNVMAHQTLCRCRSGVCGRCSAWQD